jgi:hypothetical protein
MDIDSDRLLAIASARIVSISSGIRDTANEDGAILLDVEQGLCLSLNVVGAKIWQMLKQNDSAAEIINRLEKEFKDVARNRLIQDYVDFIEDLQKKKLVVVIEAPTGLAPLGSL